MNKVQKGRRAEVFVKKKLILKGFLHVESNFNCKHGEIDLIMRDKNELVFIEVKSLNKSSLYNIYSTISNSKRISITKAVNQWLLKKSMLDCSWRVDFAGVVDSKTGFKFVFYEKYYDINMKN